MEAMKLFNHHSFHLQNHSMGQPKLQLSSTAPLGLKNVSFIKTSSSISSKPQTQFASLENPSQKPQNKGGFSSNELIMEFTEHGLFEDAIMVYVRILQDGFQVQDFKFFPCLIKSFGGLSDVKRSRQIHGHVLKLGFLADIYVVNALLGMYFKCGEITDAVQVFDKMSERDSVSWNSMISGFYQSGDYLDSLMIFSLMVKEHGLFPNRVGCLSALSSCASIKSWICGREIHGFVLKNGLESDEFLFSGLIEMYMKCGDVRSAEHVFSSTVNKESVRMNTVIWNVMISGYVSNECLLKALELFVGMLEFGLKPDSSTLVAALVFCSQLLDLNLGKQIHRLILACGFENDIRIQTALIEMYFKCCHPESGLKIFRRCCNDNLVAWGAVISNSAYGDCPFRALELFCNFMLNYGFPDSPMLLAVLRSCSSLALKSKGMETHCLAVKTGSISDFYVGSALVDMYGKCGDMEAAQNIFSRLRCRDLVAWNALICGYSQNELVDEALAAFRDMQREGIRPNIVTIACILSICAHVSVRILCKEAHCFVIRQGWKSNVLVSNSLVAAYAKCGDINYSWIIFENMHERNQVSWNSIISALGMHGDVDKMVVYFEKMKQNSMKPDLVTFTSLLSACSHAGRVDMGCKFFQSMVEEYKLQPQVEHYTCMVDLLGRAGHLSQAYDLIMDMPCEPDDRIWGSLLGSCRSHGDEKLAKVVADHVFKLDALSIGYRVLLANLYKDLGKANEVANVRLGIKDMGLKKQPGCSWIEIDNDIHIFVAGDRTHNLSEEIYAVIESLTLEIKSAGYVPHLPLRSLMPDEADC
ncbi:hypothetical protein F3Y22_tig00003041pilonHSYRG00374 [Hibiscus syriacus]|uniref:Pentatricopeptide repeat-containing protein n=2 Tax=Hibiscus syriacus TaxID=106335 RepID=A0A6A3CM89_HIBSY|nr:hypothetical protein F3Y22_tig00003041pilonHSYRG00374 [Hibiscus syriacus]